MKRNQEFLKKNYVKVFDQKTSAFKKYMEMAVDASSADIEGGSTFDMELKQAKGSIIPLAKTIEKRIDDSIKNKKFKKGEGDYTGYIRVLVPLSLKEVKTLEAGEDIANEYIAKQYEAAGWEVIQADVNWDMMWGDLNERPSLYIITMKKR